MRPVLLVLALVVAFIAFPAIPVHNRTTFWDAAWPLPLPTSRPDSPRFYIDHIGDLLPQPYGNG